MSLDERTRRYRTWEQLTRVMMILNMWEDLRESPPDTHNALPETEYDDRVQKQCGKDSKYVLPCRSSVVEADELW